MLRKDVRLVACIATVVLMCIVAYQYFLQESSRAPTPELDIQDVDFVPNRKFEHGKESHKQKHQVDKDANSEEYTPSTLPALVVSGVRGFVFFVGYARSGHSIVASMLDAHPNIVIAHEYSLFSKWQEDPLHRNKHWLFSTLYDNSLYHNQHGLRTKDAIKKGYSLAIPGLWQGMYDNFISIIGDKSGGMTAQAFRKNKERFIDTFHQLQDTVQVPIYVIHVLRNPYDNIATMLLYNSHQKFGVNSSKKYVDHVGLKEQIQAYFKQVESVSEMIRTVPLKNVIEVHNSDMIANPKDTLRKLCQQLHVECLPEYLHMCTERTFVSESTSRHLVEWTPDLIDIVANKLKEFKHLQRYSFSV